MLDIKVPVPTYDRQLWFDKLLSKVKAAEHRRFEQATILAALLPSILDRALDAH
jgi:type I restriction enzyme S subunit